MCGINGAFNRDESFALYEANLVRGRYSAGLLTDYISDSIIPVVLKSPTPFKKEDVFIGGRVYLFHGRTPTSRVIEYSEEDTHPFKVDNVYVAHNGIITNAEMLAETYGIDYSIPGVSLVDSYIIPYIIQASKKLDMSWPTAIIRTLEQLEGTFALWIYIDGDIYICRSGSTLYANFSNGSFSSSPSTGFKFVPDGKLFRISSHGIEELGTFKVKPMYYIHR